MPDFANTILIYQYDYINNWKMKVNQAIWKNASVIIVMQVKF